MCANVAAASNAMMAGARVLRAAKRAHNSLNARALSPEAYNTEFAEFDNPLLVWVQHVAARCCTLCFAWADSVCVCVRLHVLLRTALNHHQQTHSINRPTIRQHLSLGSWTQRAGSRACALIGRARQHQNQKPIKHVIIILEHINAGNGCGTGAYMFGYAYVPWTCCVRTLSRADMEPVSALGRRCL